MTSASVSRQLAGLVGPALIALSVTEAVNLDIFARPIARVVYLNGAILFVAGLAIIRAHNRWTWNWTMLLTLTGWFALLGGLYRMVFPNAPQAAENILLTYAMLAAIGAAGAVLSFNAYSPARA